MPRSAFLSHQISSPIPAIAILCHLNMRAAFIDLNNLFLPIVVHQVVALFGAL